MVYRLQAISSPHSNMSGRPFKYTCTQYWLVPYWPKLRHSIVHHFTTLPSTTNRHDSWPSVAPSEVGIDGQAKPQVIEQKRYQKVHLNIIDTRLRQGDNPGHLFSTKTIRHHTGLSNTSDTGGLLQHDTRNCNKVGQGRDHGD